MHEPVWWRQRKAATVRAWERERPPPPLYRATPISGAAFVRYNLSEAE